MYALKDSGLTSQHKSGLTGGKRSQSWNYGMTLTSITVGISGFCTWFFYHPSISSFFSSQRAGISTESRYEMVPTGHQLTCLDLTCLFTAFVDHAFQPQTKN